MCCTPVSAEFIVSKNLLSYPHDKDREINLINKEMQEIFKNPAFSIHVVLYKATLYSLLIEFLPQT